MGTLTQALSIALSGLQTNQALIALSSKNIANASTPGYTSKTATVDDVDYGTQFGGVTITGYARATNQALTQDYNAATSSASYSSTQNQYMTQIQAALNSSNSNPTLESDIATFSNAWSTYSANPESTSNQQGLISAGQTLANDIQSAVTNVATLQTQIQSNISTNITSLNADLKQISALNLQIQDATAAGLQTVDLQDQLDNQVQSISQYMNVSVQQRANGQIALYTPSGQVLVDQQSAEQFTYNGSVIMDQNGTNVTSAMSGGSLQAAVDFIGTSASDLASNVPGVGVIGKFSAQMSTLCAALTDPSGAFGSAYNSAVSASTATGATQAGDSLANSFFTVTTNVDGTVDPTTFQVNSTLVKGTSDLPQTGVQNIANSFNVTANYTASGLNAPNVTYTGLTNAIISGFQQSANIISSQSATAGTQQTYYQQTIADNSGVNTDTELANLVTYQNSYAAVAHVMSTIDQMLTTLMSVLS